MRIVITYCKNCGAKYKWQASGQYCLKTPHEYNDREYCPECKRAIMGALAPIEKKSFITWIHTDEVDIETLRGWENERMEELKFLRGNQPCFPIMKRVFANLLGQDTLHVEGRGIHKGWQFNCTYITETDEVVSMTTKVRVDMDGNILEHLTD